MFGTLKRVCQWDLCLKTFGSFFLLQYVRPYTSLNGLLFYMFCNWADPVQLLNLLH